MLNYLLDPVTTTATKEQAWDDFATDAADDAPLMALIDKKYRIKNTTGYSINALADFAPANPIEVTSYKPQAPPL